MTQLLLMGDGQTITQERADHGALPYAGVGDDTSAQDRNYEWCLGEWAKFTVTWIWHNDHLQSVRSQERYWSVWLDCFAPYGNKFEGMAFNTDVERAMRITQIINASPVKPWDFDSRSATKYKVAMENRTHITGRAERKGKKGGILQRETRVEKHLSPKSIDNALAVLSSYFRKAGRYLIWQDGVEEPLFTRTNPVDSIDRPRYETMFVREGFTADQVNKVLSVIPIDTVRGAMHYALVLAYALTGRRNSEIRESKFGDFRVDGDGKVWHTWKGKHHLEGVTDQVHRDVWSAIELYLKMSGRLDSIQTEDYIFTATGSQPICCSEVWRIVQMYLRRAKIKGHYTVHSFRHGLAEQMIDMGARDSEVQRQLGHSNPATTQIYHAKRKQEMSQSIDRVGDNIGSARLLNNRQQLASS